MYQFGRAKRWIPVKDLSHHMNSNALSQQADASRTVQPSTSPPGAGLALFATLLASGGDERLAIDPRSGRNHFGVPAGSPSGEIWSSSATASAISARGHAAGLRALEAATRGQGARPLPVWFDEIRQRLLALFAPAAGGEIVLSASIAEAELILLAIAQSVFSRPSTTLVAAPPESDETLLLAADGRHFSKSAPFAADVLRGAKLAGFDSDRRVELIETRDRYGAPLESRTIDRMVTERVNALVASGRDILLHVLDCSETGQSGPSRRAAAAMAAAFPENVVVVVDAGQLRCSRERLCADLDAGFAVMLTGSKFAGGPPSSGALLLPPALAARLDSMVLPEGLSDYSAALDWSPALRGNLRGEFSTLANIGLGLRWECALAELEAYFTIDGALREQIAARFAQEIYAHLAASPQLKLADRDWRPTAHARTIFPILTFDDHGRAISAEKLHRALRDPATQPVRRRKMTRLDCERSNGQRPIHLGQPVAIGEMQALRLCLGAAQVNEAAQRVAEGEKFDYAFRPLADDLAEVFGRWNDLAAREIG